MMGPDVMGDVGDMLTMCNRMRIDTNYTRDVVVTGFDTPFEDCDVNPSAAVVDELMKEKIENVKISPHKIPATYEGVIEKLPDLLQTCPDEVIHLAAHNIKNTIYFQDRAFFNGYCREDMNGFIPEDNKIICDDESDEEQKVRKPFIDFDYLVEEVTENCGLDGEKFGGLKVEKSNDPGRFVGGYLYYLSLRERPVNTLFVHVPPFEGECSKEAVADVIREAIRVMTRNDF